MEKFMKYWQLIVGVLGGTLIAVFGWFYTQGQQSKEYEGRTFDTPEQKVYTVKKVENLPSPKEEWQKYYLDSINNVSAIKSRKVRDSLMIVERKAREYTDSINLLNADQLYQTKEEVKQIKSVLQRLENRSN